MAGVAGADFEMFYLGSAPCKDATDAEVTATVEMLCSKLAELQKRTIDKIVVKKHKTRLSEASPVYKKIAAKLEKKGLDCTKGDQIGVTFDEGTLNIKEAATDQITQIPLREILSNFTMTTKTLDKYVLAFVHTDGVSHLCHAVTGVQAKVEIMKLAMSTRIAMIAPTAEGKTASMGSMISRTEGAASNRDSVIKLGIGLHKSMGMDAPGAAPPEGPIKLGRKASINLKGSSKGGVQRSSKTYGASFASFGFGPPPGALQWQQPPDAATAGDSNGPLPGVAEDGGDDLLDDEDLLAGGVADMFSEHDDGDN